MLSRRQAPFPWLSQKLESKAMQEKDTQGEPLVSRMQAKTFTTAFYRTKFKQFDQQSARARCILASREEGAN